MWIETQIRYWSIRLFGTRPVSRELMQRNETKVTALIDFTWTGWSRGRKAAVMSGVPYIRIEPLLGTFLRATEAVIAKKEAADAVLIFASEDEVDEAIFTMLGRSLLRVLVLNGLNGDTIEKLLRMRPSPSYFAIFSDSIKVMQLFREATVGGLVFLDDRWILAVKDFRRPVLNSTGRQVMMVSPARDSCCAFMPEGECRAGPCGGAGGDAVEWSAAGISDGWTGERRPGCRSDIESLFVERVAELLAGSAAALAVNSRSSSSSGTGGKDLTKPDSSQCRENCTDQPPMDFYAAVGRTSASSTLVGASEIPAEVWDNSSSSVLCLFPRFTVDVDVFSGQASPPSKVATWLADGAAASGTWGEMGLVVETRAYMPPQRPYLRVGIVEMVPWAYWEEDPIGGGKWTGYCVDFMKALAERMEVDYELVAYRDGYFGDRRVDGTWDGAIGDLAKGETDLLVASTVMTSEREEVIDFVAPYFEQTGISIVIRKPVRKTSLFKFMTVLRFEVWLSIVGALTVTGFMIWFLDKYSPYSAQNNKKMYPYPCRKFTLKESFWFALTSFTPQGGGEAPKALSSRTLVAAYWLFVVLMLATFTANLAAFLTVERMQSPVQSLEQLARQSRINYTVVKNSNTHQYFINMKNAEETLYRVWKEITLNSTNDLSRYRVWDYPIKEQYGHILLAIEQTGPVSSAAEGIKKVIASETGEFAFIHDAAQVRYETSRNCNLTEVGEPFAEQPFAIAVQTGSHLQEEISRRILDLQKDRFFEALTGKYWNASAKGDCPNADDMEGITLESLGGVFIATLFGLALAMVTLAGEIFYYKRKKMMAQKTLEKVGWLEEKADGKKVKMKNAKGGLKTRVFGQLWKERASIKHRKRKRGIAPAPTISMMSQNSENMAKVNYDVNHGNNHLTTQNRLTQVSYDPIYRDYDERRQNINTYNNNNRFFW
ncbi:ionotropic receptor 25a isoform X2 [Ischnura elegans]|uniref:ionotropic receptor 25a isoform X2 n=1 Tax=Ischnura elegans TaxID=197161 RepID=UPI001ED88B40|nr:ionotropic receptor 25a isoform X2 [Ischnura elegans]